MKTLTALFIALFLCGSGVQAQHGHPHQLRPGSFDGLILKYSPLSILPAPASEIRFGAEYVVNGRIGIGLDYGYVLHSLNIQGYKSGDGFALHPGLRAYLGNRPNMHFYCGVEGFYRHETFGSGNFDYIRNHSLYQRAYEDAGEKTVYGIDTHGGFVLSVGPHFRLEMGGGIGIKEVKYAREGFKSGSLILSKPGNQAPGENYVLDTQPLPYLIFDLKLCLRTGW